MSVILIVDDEPLIRWSVGESLEHAGHQVLEAGSAREALRHFDVRSDIAAVILDLKLPDSSDLGLLQQILSRAPGCRVILITAHGTAEVFDDARAAGAYDALAKPFDMPQIVRVVDDALAHA